MKFFQTYHQNGVLSGAGKLMVSEVMVLVGKIKIKLWYPMYILITYIVSMYLFS